MKIRSPKLDAINKCHFSLVSLKFLSNTAEKWSLHSIYSFQFC